MQGPQDAGIGKLGEVIRVQLVRDDPTQQMIGGPRARVARREGDRRSSMDSLPAANLFRRLENPSSYSIPKTPFKVARNLGHGIAAHPTASQ